MIYVRSLRVPQFSWVVNADLRNLGVGFDADFGVPKEWGVSRYS